MNLFKNSTLKGYFELLQGLVVRNLKIKYQRSALGFLWTLIQPATIAILIISIFSYVVRIPIQNYWAFLLSGFVVWNFIQQCLNAAAYIFPDHASVIRSIALRKEILIVGAALSRLVEFILELIIVLVIVALAHHQTVPVSFLLIPVFIILQVLLVIGMALPIAIISLWYHDIQHALPVLLLALFWLSPVFYPVSMVPEDFQSWYLYNPIAQILELYHVAVYEGHFPSVVQLAETGFICLGIFLLGYLFFYRYQNSVAEIV